MRAPFGRSSRVNLDANCIPGPSPLGRKAEGLFCVCDALLSRRARGRSLARPAIVCDYGALQQGPTTVLPKWGVF